MKPYFEILDLPAVPDHLEQEIRKRVLLPEFKVIKSHLNIPGFSDYHLRKLSDVNGSKKTSVFSDRYQSSKELVEWVSSNVYTLPASVNINITNLASDSFGPHVDYNRRSILIYVIEQGGTNVLTKWWQQLGYPLHRPEMQDVSNGWAINCDDYSQLEERASICIPPRTWIRFCDTSILHSVENLESQRLTIQIPIL